MRYRLSSQNVNDPLETQRRASENVSDLEGANDVQRRCWSQRNLKGPLKINLGESVHIHHDKGGHQTMCGSCYAVMGAM